MVPCFDEPAMKAQFALNVIRPKQMNAQSNMIISKTEKHIEWAFRISWYFSFQSLRKMIDHDFQIRDEDWEIDHFERSVQMSTYLLALIVSDFEKISLLSKKYGIKVEVTASPEAIRGNLGNYSLYESADLLDFYSDYFNVPYPLKKSSEQHLVLFKKLSQSTYFWFSF